MENMTLLIEKSRQGDREAFAWLVEKYQGMVSAVTLNIVGDYALSEDLAQETFLTAWTKLPELREPEKSASWFYGIARRVALRWRERQKKNPLKGASELDEQAIPDTRTTLEAEKQLQREQSLQLVWSTVRELPEIFREPLLLYYRYSRSVADIAESMQLTEQAIRQRLSRGRKMLKEEVEKQVETVLESTRPDTAFTLAVLAAIPLAATASGCAASVASAATSKSIGMMSGGTAMGGPWIILAILTVLLFLIFHSTWMILLTTITFYALWQAIRRAPTLKIRRLIISAALDFNLLLWGWYFFDRLIMMIFAFDTSFTRSLKPLAQTLSRELQMFLYLGIPMFLVFSAFVVYVVLQWQRLLNEEQGVGKSRRVIPASPNRGILFDDQRQFLIWFVRRIQLWLKRRQSAKRLQSRWKIYRIVIVICLAVYIWHQVAFMFTVFRPAPPLGLSTIAIIAASSLWYFLLQIGIQIVFFKITNRGIKISRDREIFSQTSLPQSPDTVSSDETMPFVRYSAMRDLMILLLMVPYTMMFLAVVLDLIRPMLDDSLVRISIFNGSIYTLVKIAIVLVIPTVFWISRNPAKRDVAFSTYFLVSGILTVFFFEYHLIIQNFLWSYLQAVFFWWVPETDKFFFGGGSLHEIQANPYWTLYFVWHLFAAI